MKFLVIICLSFLLVSCSQSILQNDNSLPISIVEPDLTEIEKIAKLKRVEKDKEDIKEFINEEVRQYGLSSLVDRSLPQNDFEVRVWRFAAFGEKDLAFILKKSNENWFAELVQKTTAGKSFNKKNPVIKYSRRNLGKPKSNWENLWRELTDNEILTLPTGSEVDNEVCPDCWLYIVETKVQGNYRVYSYHAPEEFKEIREAQQMTKIISRISQEFALSDFDQNNFMQP